MVECLRARQSAGSQRPDVEQHGDYDTDSPELIIEEAIREYQKALQVHKHNQLLWVYSAYSASRGFPSFEQRHNLPREVLWAMLAEAHKAANQYKEAAEAYAEAIKALPDNQWLINSLGEMYELSGELAMAAEAKAKAETVTGVYGRRLSSF